MKRTIIFIAIFASMSVMPALAQTTDSDKLLQRLTAQGGGTAQVFVSKLPTDMPKVPLPNGSIIGDFHSVIIRSL